MRRVSVLQSHTFRQSLINLLRYNAHDSVIDLAAAVRSQGAVSSWNVVKQKDQIERDGNDQLDHRQHPDDQGEQHTNQDNGS